MEVIMVITYDHADTYMDDVNCQQALHELADFLFQEQDFLLDASDALKKTTLGDFELWRMTYLKKILSPKRKSKLQKTFDSLLYAVYDLARRPPAGFNEKDYLQKLRGGVLEVLVARFLMERYNSMGCNCHVHIDNEPLKGTNDHAKTLDVAGVDKLNEPGKGELYECKIGSQYIKHHHLDFIKKARRQLDGKGLGSVLVSIVSFENRIFLKQRFSKLNFKGQKMIPFQEIRSLNDYNKVKVVLTG